MRISLHGPSVQPKTAAKCLKDNFLCVPGNLDNLIMLIIARDFGFIESFRKYAENFQMKPSSSQGPPLHFQWEKCQVPKVFLQETHR